MASTLEKVKVDPKAVMIADGFIKRCHAEGLDETQTSVAFRRSAMLGLLQSPNIQRGFTERIKQAGVDAKALERHGGPELLPAVVETCLHYGDTMFADHFRNRYHPDMEDPGVLRTKVASALMDRLDDLPEQYAALSPQQKVMLGAALGGIGGSALRASTTTPMDRYVNRGTVSKAIRGAMTGAATGAGAAAAHTFTHDSLEGADPEARQIAALIAALGGGYAGNQAIHAAGSLVQ